MKKTLLAFALVLVAMTGSSPAFAHTDVDHTTPAASSTVEAGTQTISVVFSDKILNLADSSEFVITDGNGDEVATSCLEVKNTSINIEAFLATAGDYKVVWRTVAEDGHPISGDFGFTVTGSAEDSNFVSCKNQASEGSVVIATPKAEPLAAETKDQANVLAVAWPFWAAGALVVAVGVLVFVRRKGSKG